jgi:predicted Zn-dependent protease
VFAQVRFRVGGGALPLSLSPAGAVRVDGAQAIAAEIDRWVPVLSPGEDRRRLALAIAEWVRAYVRQGGDLREAAMALHDLLVRVDPRHASAMVTLGGLYDRLGDPASAIAWTRRALELEPDRPAALLNLALYLARDPASQREALALCEYAVELRPWRRDGWQRLADVREAAGDAEGAAAARAQADAVGERTP